MTNNLEIYLKKTKFLSSHLQDLIKLNLIIKSYYNLKKLNILTWIEIDINGLYKSEKNKDEKLNLLFNFEYILPSKFLELTKIIGYRIENFYKKKINFSKVTLNLKKTILIYWLELIGSYRGWRHIHGLPVHGQRTWTNAWSVYKSNLNLRDFILDLSKNIYKTSNISSNTLRVAYMAEHINKMWSIQWELEWRKSKKKRISSFKKNLKHYTVDLVRLASGNVNTKKIRKNRKKQADEKKNLFYLGFDKGFTKYLLENKTLSNPNLKKTNTKKKIQDISKLKEEQNKLNIIFNQEKKQSKKKQVTKKKKIELQAKKKKQILLKKKKKSVWD